MWSRLVEAGFILIIFMGLALIGLAVGAAYGMRMFQ